MRVVPSTWMIVTCVPGSITVASLDAPRQSSPSTFTRPGNPPGPIRSVTMAVLPRRASTPVRKSEPGPSCNKCMSLGRRPAMLTTLDTAKAIPCVTKPKPGTSPTTPATAAPTARHASQNPAVNISPTSNPIATRNQISQSCIRPKSCNPYGRSAIQLAPTPCGVAMTVRAFLLIPAALLLSFPLAAQTSRYVLQGDSVSVYNLVGELRVEAGSGS